MKFRRHHAGISARLLVVMTGFSQFYSGLPREHIETSHNNSLPSLDLKFLQQRCRRFKSSGMWHDVTEQVPSDVLNDLRVNSHVELLGPEDKGTKIR
jgi:hypothetical protein